MKKTLVLGVILAASGTDARRVGGNVRLAPGQAKVITKFCFDYDIACREVCPNPPGKLDAFFFGGAQLVGGQVVAGSDPNVQLAMLDDEYFSFPEVSPVWDRAKCSDITKAAKSHYSINWAQASKDVGFHLDTFIVEKVRPRWWYVAIASCSDQEILLSYSLHLQNPLQGSQVELSMDERGLALVAQAFMYLFGAIAGLQLWSVQQWSQSSRRTSPPGQFMLSVAVGMAFVGQFWWRLYFQRYQESGEEMELQAGLARFCVTFGKTLVSMLLVLLAYGECVCRPGIDWAKHRDSMIGLTALGIFGFVLEMWSDSQARNSTTEYIYDTRPGMAFIALDLVWLWVYCSRCWQTLQEETRVRQRYFYRYYAPVFALWFAALPIVSCIAAVLAPWVRAGILFLVTGLIHAAALTLLVYSFLPGKAAGIYELRDWDHEASAARADELTNLLKAQVDDDPWSS